MKRRVRVLLVSIVPPQNDCGVRIVMYRHLVERNPFDLYVATSADWVENDASTTKLKLPYWIHRLRKSRFGPRVASWVTDYENLVWSATVPVELDLAIKSFRPDVILTLVETGLSRIAARAADKYNLPLVGLFLDWFPVMKDYYGHRWTRRLLDRQFRKLYRICDLAFCTSEGMKEALGSHPRSHVLYPMPGLHTIAPRNRSVGAEVQIAYVGSVENFYGRMLCRLLGALEHSKGVKLTIAGPNADWPENLRQRYTASGNYLGFQPPAAAAEILADADLLLVVMSFEKEHELFMRTSFPTKFLDYVNFGKPIILWGPEYCAPVRLAARYGGAAVVDIDDAEAVVSMCRQLASNASARQKYIEEASELRASIFNADRLQKLFVTELESLARERQLHETV